MADKLKSVKYNGCYFDRREEAAVRLCTAEGWFSCQVSSALSEAEPRFWQAAARVATTSEGGNSYLDACVVQHQVWRGAAVLACVICGWFQQGKGLRWGGKRHACHCSRLVLQGPFDRGDCACKHSINPYSNRESRIVFSTWNLDHMYVPSY